MTPATPRPGLRRRLVASSVALIASTLAAFGLAVRFAVEQVLLRSTIDTLHNQADNWETARPKQPRNRPPEDRPEGPPDPLHRAGRARRQRFPFNPGPPRPFHPPRIVAVDNPDPRDRSMTPWDNAGVAAARAFGEDLRRGTIDDVQCIILSRAVRLPDGRGAVLQVAGALDHVESAVMGLSLALVILFPLAVGAATLLGSALTRRILRPVDQLVAAAGELDVARPDIRLPDQSADEFGRLGAVLNTQIDRMHDAYERQRRFSADASHELRTPLAVIKTSAQITRQHLPLMNADEIREALESIESGADRAHRLVQDLLILARGERGLLNPRRETFSLQPFLEQCVAQSRTTASDSAPHVRIQVDPAGLGARTDPDMLQRIVCNVVDNGLRHTPSSGEVLVDATCDTDGSVRITIADNGPGMSAEILARVGQPFQRPDAARSRDDGGAGLGLALCRTFAAALGATFTLESTPGVGTFATVVLPPDNAETR
jgi:signal transduction histidine kinase